jgi:putative hydrolase of the HAD superfamily
METQKKGAILFDWGDTLMRVFPEFSGPMKDWARVEAVAGAAGMLAALQEDWTLCLATNAADSEEADIRAALRRVGLAQWLEKIYCFKKIGHRKPSHEFFEYVLKDLGVPASWVIMVGDDLEADVLGAVRCGLRGIWFNEGGREERQAGNWKVVHDLREIKARVERAG